MALPIGFSRAAALSAHHAAQQEYAGTPVAYRERVSAATYTVLGVMRSGPAVEASGAYRQLWAPLSEFVEEPAKGDTVTADGVIYRVTSVERYPDGGRVMDLEVTR